MIRAITPKDQEIDNEKGNLGFIKCQQSLRVGQLVDRVPICLEKVSKWVGEPD